MICGSQIPVKLINGNYYWVKFISDGTIEIGQYLCDNKKAGFYFCGDLACYDIGHFEMIAKVY